MTTVKEKAKISSRGWSDMARSQRMLLGSVSRRDKEQILPRSLQKEPALLIP